MVKEKESSSLMDDTNAPMVDVDGMKKVIKLAVTSRETVGFMAEPGVGKSEIIYQTSEEISKEKEMSHCSEPTDETWKNPKVWNTKTIILTAHGEEDFGGIPKNITIDNKDYFHFVSNTLIPLEEWCGADGGNGIIFLDEIGNASEPVKNAVQNILSSRLMNGKKISDNVTFILATNEMKHNSGTGYIGYALKSRAIWYKFNGASVSELIDNLDKLGRPLHPSISMFLMFKERALKNFDADSPSFAFACPRTWVKASNIITKNNIVDRPTRVLVIGGCVGANIANDYNNFEKLGDVVKIKDLLAKPQMINDFTDMRNPGTLFSIMLQMADYVTTNPKDLDKALIVMAQLKDNTAVATIFLRGLRQTMPKQTLVNGIVKLSTSHPELDKMVKEILEASK